MLVIPMNSPRLVNYKYTNNYGITWISTCHCHIVGGHKLPSPPVGLFVKRPKYSRYTVGSFHPSYSLFNYSTNFC